MREFNEAIRLNPDYAEAYFNRGKTRREQGNIDRALGDFNEAIRLKPDFADALYSRALSSWSEKTLFRAALADYQKYLDLGGGVQEGNQSLVERIIQQLEEKL